MLRETYREQGGPRVYRVVMAVRNVERQPGRSPLVGLIDVRLPAPQSDEMLLLTRLILVLAGMLAGFLAILVFYLISQKLILAPVRELKELAEEIAAGDLSARAALETGDEFEELSDSFNNMLTQLEGSRLELETINRSLDARLGELAETNVALYEANKIKSEFLANVSHELRTPLTSIIGFADLLRDFLQSKEEPEYGRLARYANNIITSGRQLLDMINDLLELTRMEAGKVTLHRTRFSVLDVCEALFDFMRPIVDKKQLTLTSEVTDDLPHLHSDAGKLRQILYNLLSNAVKYTPEGGRVELTARSLEDGQKVELTVRDTGPGIAPEDHERIFEKFRQLDASVTREQGGTGLGLAITKELCQMLGGEIHLESQPGRGAKFIVLLPVESPTTAQRNLTPLT
jgi:signal transduction histidine kinase